MNKLAAVSTSIPTLVLVAGIWWLGFGLPAYFDLVFLLVLLVGAGVALRRAIEVLIASVSCLLAIGVVIGAAQFLVAPEYGTYRENERYSLPNRPVYQPNIEAVVQQPHGDLLVIDPFVPQSLAQSRDVFFKTDSRGYRNRTEYAGEVDILVGDSFIVANGTSQEQNLSEVLINKYGIKNYNLSYPSTPLAYEARFKDSLTTFPLAKGARAHFFFYEGNDFEVPPPELNKQLDIGYAKPLLPEAIVSALDNYETFKSKIRKIYIPILRAPSLLNGVARRFEARWVDRQRSAVLLVDVHGRTVGLFSAHTLSALNAAPQLDLAYDSVVWNRAGCVFFIPTAARVYEGLIASPAWSPMAQPPPAFELLKKKLASYPLRIVDLTPILQAFARGASAETLPFWSDDTHWSGYGIAAVAETVANCIWEKWLQKDLTVQKIATRRPLD